MLKYKLNVSGSVCDVDTDFRCGFDISVENGGSVENVGLFIQGAIDRMKEKGHPIEKPESDSSKKSVEQK